MARIAGIDLPKDKRIEIGLTYIYGTGRKSAQDILAQTGINPDTRVKDLTADEEAKIRDYIDKNNIMVARSAAIAAPVIAAACPFAVSAARPTHAPARAPRRPLRTRRSKEGE